MHIYKYIYQYSAKLHYIGTTNFEFLFYEKSTDQMDKRLSIAKSHHLNDTQRT